MQAKLRVMSGDGSGRVYVVRVAQTFVLGRGEGASVRFHDSVVSRRHAQIQLDPDGTLTITDLNSANGTFLQGRRLEPGQKTRVLSGDAITIGGSVLSMLIEGADDDSRLARRQLQMLDEVDLPDEFELLGAIGEGAYGRVYAAKQGLLDRTVAIKILNHVHREGDEDWQRFLREGQTCCRLKSPFVVKVFDIRQADGRIYLVMEFVNGPTARDRLSGGPISIAEALEIGQHVGMGLQAVHDAGVVHRDVKPSNVLITPQGIAKLGDFGLAKDTTTQEHLTQSDFGLGSLAYVSPEQATSARTVDHRADIYGLGATIYHLLAGRPPFFPKCPKALMRMIEDPPTELSTLRCDCPPDVCRLIHAMLEKDPAARPPTAASAARQLGELRELHFPDAPVSLLPDPRHRETARLPKGYYLAPEG